MVHCLGVRPLLVLGSVLRGRSNGAFFRERQFVGVSSRRVHRNAGSLKVFASNKVAKAHEDVESETLAAAAGASETKRGLKYEGVVEKGECKVRLDQWLTRQLPHVSRARVQTSIRHGLALVNGLPANKVRLLHCAPHCFPL